SADTLGANCKGRRCPLFFLSNPVTSIPQEAMSLLAFKKSISVDPFRLLLDWNVTNNYCSWYGVTCTDKRVTSLNITGTYTTSLTGTLAAEVGNLTELRALSLPHNNFTGNIPVEITRLMFLEVLELQGNRLSGSLHRNLGEISSLGLLNVSYNLLSGSIPEKLIGSARIRSIDLSYNQLNGRIVIDSESRCESLVYLKLSGNFLTDRIPAEIGNCSNLRSVLLDENILEYRIPPEIGKLSQLENLDVSRNSLTDKIPKELGNCSKLFSLVLTNLVDSQSGRDSIRGEFNAFDGGIPPELLLLSELEILWAPRANLGGRLPRNWSASCKLHVVNLGQNYFTGLIPRGMGLCRNLSFLDLSSNLLLGSIPSQLPVPCMVYFNVSRNSLSGHLPRFPMTSCTSSMISSYSQDGNLVEKQYIGGVFLRGSWINEQLPSDGEFVVVHDFSWNILSGALPLFSFGDGFASMLDKKPSYKLLLNDNRLNGSLPDELFSACEYLQSLEVNVTINQISGEISGGLLLNCSQLTGFEAAYNELSGLIPPGISGSQMLEYLDLRENRLTGSIPDQIGKMKSLRWILLGGNKLTGKFPTQLGQLSSLVILDLSENALTGRLPDSLVDATQLQVLLVDHNKLFGEIPSSFSSLASLIILDVSFNNLSGLIPDFQHRIGCDGFRGNKYLQPCSDPTSASPSGLPVPLWHGQRKKMRLVIISMVTSASVLAFILVTVIVLVPGRRKLARFASLRRKLVVSFVEVPTELNYDNVVRATGNFSVQYLIGTGGFGATYKAELVPGFLVAVKRLSIGRFQGVQQFDAEIRTLGRIHHKNLVTLIGYHMGETEMVSDKADVYSFGVVLLELMSGKRTLDPSFSEYGNGFNIVSWAQLLINDRRSSEFFSPVLWEVGPQANLLGMLRLASSCTVEALSVRPSMEQVTEKLKQLKIPGS
ncbi:hypothetical protein IFM89_004400, partial [Coptis chinensis]